MALTVVAAAAAVVWALVLVFTFLVSASRRASADGGATVDPPALAAVLTAAYDRIGPVGALATRFDLIARGLIVAESNAAGRWLLPAPIAAPMLPYERRVVALVAERAARGGGRAPAELTIGSEEQTKRWNEAFRDAVVADARARGLVAPRVPGGLRALLYFALLVPYALACLATGHALLAIGWFLIPAVLLSLPVRLLARPVPRGAGPQAAAVCRRLRAELAANPPPAWPVRDDRRLAYAAALGVSISGAQISGVSASGVPESSEPGDGAVWSNRTGTWTRIEVARRRGILSGSDPHTVLWGLPGALLFFTIWGGLLTWFERASPRRGVATVAGAGRLVRVGAGGLRPRPLHLSRLL
jgi:hypothetical protein